MVYSIDHVKDILTFWNSHNNLPGQYNKDIIAFIGPTKAGKSTLISSLLKEDLIGKKCEVTGDIWIAKKNESSNGPKIGHQAESESASPDCYGNLSGTKLLMYDFPGFGDNKGSKQEVANAISIKSVLCQQKSVRFAFVVPFDIIKQSDPLPFFKMLHNLLNISQDIANHLCLVASKFSKGNLKLTLNKLVNLSFSGANIETIALINKSKSIIKVLLQNDATIEFKCPIMNDDIFENVYELSNAEDIHKCLKNVKGLNISKCNLVLSDKANYELLELYDTVYICLKSGIENVLINFKNWTKGIIDGLHSEENSCSNDEIKKFLKDVIQKLKNLEISNDIQSLLSIFGYLEDCQPVIDISVNFNHLESLKNHYGKQFISGENEFCLMIKCGINESIELFNEEILKIDSTSTQLAHNEIVAFQESRSALSETTLVNVKYVCSNILSFCSRNKILISRLVISMVRVTRQPPTLFGIRVPNWIIDTAIKSIIDVGVAFGTTMIAQL